jgi:threonine dehydrogenase-like Zn-dependent dehydrogenase
LILEAPGQVAWRDVPEPDLRGPGEALVRPLAVALCDLDAPLIHGRTPFPLPVALGHEAVAEVVAVGRDVRSVTPGDRVVVPFQLSCGTCHRCADGQTGTCATLGGTPMYGFGAVGGDHGGMLSDLARVPYADAMLVPVPEAIDDLSAIAGVADNVPDGWRTVAGPLARHPGADVLIVGGGTPSIALYAVDAARALGAGRIDYVDPDPQRRAIAADLGAEVHEELPPGRWPITVDAGATGESVAAAARATAPGGHCTSVGIVFEPATPMPLLEMYLAGVTFAIGRAMVRPAIPAILEHAAAGRLRLDRVVDHVAAWDDAAEAVGGAHVKLVIARAA